MQVFNPWHGCHKKSAGCLNCYMFRRDSLYEIDSNVVRKTATFYDLVKRHKDGSYLIKSNQEVYVCMTSDFFIEEADQWRNDIWQMIKLRSDVNIHIITKRIERFMVSLPSDWQDGYENVTICCTCENQKEADQRMPILLDLPILHKQVIEEPMLGAIDLEKYLASGQIEQVTCGGESGDKARECNYDWILDTRRQCVKYQVPFYFKQTGANFIKDGKCYQIDRKYQLSQAKKANINT